MLTTQCSRPGLGTLDPKSSALTRTPPGAPPPKRQVRNIPFFLKGTWSAGAHAHLIPFHSQFAYQSAQPVLFLTKYDENNIIEWAKAHSKRGFSVNDWNFRLDFRRISRVWSILPEKNSGEERGLLSRTAAGNRAYWKSSKPLRRLQWNSRYALIAGWGKHSSKWEN